MTDHPVRWGTEIRRRTSGYPFLCYEPRRRRIDQLLGDARRWSDRVHLVQGDRRITYGKLFAAVDRVADELARAGLEPDDRLLLLAPNSPEWVVSFWAGIQAGAIVALGNGWWSPEEVAHAVDLVSPTLIVADGREHQPPDGSRLLDVSAVRRLVDEEPQARPAPARQLSGDEDDPAVIVFTAGTTGAPKAAVLAHRSVIANVHNLLATSNRLPHQVDESRAPAVSLQSGPLFHIGGLQSLLLALLGGNRLVFLTGRFDAGEVLDVIARERVTWWGAIPTMASRVLDHPSLPGRDLTSVRSISMGGMPVQPALMDRLRGAFPNAARGMSTIYGMTETGGTVAAASGALMARHPDTAGHPMPVVELRIEAPNTGGDGEVLVRTPGQMTGYWGDPGDGLIDSDGWVHTGDQGRIVDGLLYITGRIKDLIIRGGENIAPAHVEATLLRHPAVRGAAVIGLPDPDLGERVGAIVHVDSAAAVTRQALAAFAAEHLARFEVPADWWLRTSPITMNHAGKMDKRALRAEWDAHRRKTETNGERRKTVDDIR